MGMAKVRQSRNYTETSIIAIAYKGGARTAEWGRCTVQDVVTEVAAAKDLFEQAAEILGYDLLKICTEGGNLVCRRF